MYSRIEETLFGIKKVLLNDTQIRKLLVNSSNNALNIEAPSADITSKYITLAPIYQFENKGDFEQNGMINIFLTDNNNENMTIDGVIQINIVYNVDKWELIENKIRTLELSNRIIKLINNKKFSVSNSLQYMSMQHLILTKQLVGYALLFGVTDGNSELENY